MQDSLCRTRVSVLSLSKRFHISQVSINVITKSDTGGEFSYIIAKTNRVIKSEFLQSCNISSCGEILASSTKLLVSIDQET